MPFFGNSALLKIVNLVTWIAYLIGHEKSPKLQKILINRIVKLIAFLLTDFELFTTELDRKYVKIASFSRSVFSNYLVIC